MDSDQSGSGGFSELYDAAQSGNIAEVQRLIDAGADLNTKLSNDWTPLHAAVNNGHIDVVSALLGAGADVQSQDSYGYTVLHVAASNGLDAIVEKLIAAYCAIDSRTKTGSTPLSLAAAEGHARVAELLIQGGADLDSRNICGRNTIHSAAAEGHLAVVKVLLEANPEMLSSKTKYGNDPLYLAAESGHSNLMSFLLLAGAPINTTSDNSFTALHAAVSGGHVEVVRVLLDNKADPELRLSDGTTALHIAARCGHEDIVSELVEYNENLLDARDILERTPLHLAVANPHPKVFETLLLKGADPGALDIYCGSPAEYASNHEALRTILTSNVIAKPTPPTSVVKTEHLKISLRRMTERLTGRLGDHDNTIYDAIGHLYLKLGNDREAVEAFSHIHADMRDYFTTCCSFCPNGERIDGDRFICKTCVDVDSCSSCRKTYGYCPLDPNQSHEFICVPRLANVAMPALRLIGFQSYD